MDRGKVREEIDLVSSSEEDGEDESDELGNGVQVFVDDREFERERARERESERPLTRKPVAGGGRRKGKK